MPARVFVLPVIEPTMMQRGRLAGLLAGACGEGEEGGAGSGGHE